MTNPKATLLLLRLREQFPNIEIEYQRVLSNDTHLYLLKTMSQGPKTWSRRGIGVQLGDEALRGYSVYDLKNEFKEADSAASYYCEGAEYVKNTIRYTVPLKIGWKIPDMGHPVYRRSDQKCVGFIWQIENKTWRATATECTEILGGFQTQFQAANRLYLEAE
jgi:hypothetical protein